MIGGPPTYSNPDRDLFSSEVLGRYFNAREHEVYFRSLKSENDRRNFYPRLVGALTELFAFLDDAASLELLDSVIFRNRKKLEPSDRGLQILDYLKKANPRGVELLGLNPPVTFDSLRVAYKKAAKKHHPDVGGSNEDMKLVNLALVEFHDVISRWKEPSAIQNAANAPLDSMIAYLGFEVRSAAEYLISLGVVLVRIHTDSWAADNAYAMLQSLREHGLLATSFPGQSEFAGYFPRLLVRLAKRLRTAGFVNEAKSVLDYGLPFNERAMEGDHFPEGWRSARTTLMIALEEARDILAGDMKLKVVITHPCQAENLYRLKVIDEKRYREAQARFQKHDAKDESIELDLARFRERDGFVPLAYDAPFRCVARRNSLVPVPGYYLYRIDHLSGDQRAQYFYAFGPSGSSDDVGQYLYTRMSSYLCSLIHKFCAEEAEVIERECESLRRLFPQNALNLEAVLGVSAHLRQLDSDTRKDKLSLLQRLDTTERPQPGVIVFSLSGEGAGDTHIRITPTPWYCSVVVASIERLQMALRTGSIESAEEQANEKSDWIRDVRLIRQLQGNDVTARARDTLWNHRGEPEKVVDALKPHIEQLIEAGNQMAPQNARRLLELGYWVDGVSGALVRLRKWSEAREWLELYFGLYAQYRDRLFESGTEKMLKRLARCKAQLARSQG